MKTTAKRSIIGALLLVAANPSLATAKPLFTGIPDEWVLISVLGCGVLMLFACILALTYMLYKAVPSLVAQQQNS